MGRSIEIVTTGFDDGVGGLSSNPYGAAVATSVGLRVPSLVPSGAPGPLGRYLFLLGTRVVHGETHLRGLGQLVTIGTSLPRTVSEVTPAQMPFEYECTTPSFRFPDGNISWHVVVEPVRRSPVDQVPTDTTSFKKLWSDAGPALLYQTFTATAGSTNPATGAPLSYPTTLATYTPPQIWGDWRPVAEGLGTWNDLRYPWTMPPGEDLIDVPIETMGGPQRVSFYASVLQTATGISGSALTFEMPNFPAVLPAGWTAMPEWSFIATMANLAGGPFPVSYWRIAGRMRFQDVERPQQIVVPENLGAGPLEPEVTPPGAPIPKGGPC